MGWRGTDYKDNRDACVQTQIECLVTEGEFSDDELRRLLDGLTVANPEKARSVRRVPFHRLNYWARYKCRPPVVPHGLWDYSPEQPYDESYDLSPVALARDAPVRALVPSNSAGLSPNRFRLDSALAFPDENAMELVFRNRENGSDHLWLLATAEESSPRRSRPRRPTSRPPDGRRLYSRIPKTTNQPCTGAFSAG